MMAEFHLNLKRQWFELIDNEQKTEEYREIKEHWTRVIDAEKGMFKIKGEWIPYDKVTLVFSNGYRKDRPQRAVACGGLEIRTGKQEWGAIPNRQYIVIKLVFDELPY